MAWSGLGVTAAQPYGTWSGYITDYANISKPLLPYITQFPKVRVIAEENSTNSQTACQLWIGQLRAYNPSQYILYGITHQSFNPQTFAGYLTKVQTHAQWAQDNAMDAFCVANEVERLSARTTIDVATLSRSSNVATATFAAAHGLNTGEKIIISGASPSSFNTTDALNSSTGVAVTVVNPTTITFANTGVDESATGSIKLKYAYSTIPLKIKELAAACQPIFTRGPITYSIAQSYHQIYIDSGMTPDTDLDKMSINIYGANSLSTFTSTIDTCYTAFGTNLWVTEFNIHETWSSSSVRGMTPSTPGWDLVWADQIMYRLNYIKNKGIQTAYFFMGWNSSSGANNQFCLFFNESTAGAGMSGNFKSLYYRLLGKRVETVFSGVQT
jgi:Glycosyl hydrolase catalytic core